MYYSHRKKEESCIKKWEVTVDEEGNFQVLDIDVEEVLPYDDLEGEVWKDIKGWPFHQVSNRGRIRVLPGGQVGRWKIATKIELRKLTHDIKSFGYMRIMHGNTKLLVHTLVLTAFAGPCPPGQECRYLNGIPSDNRWPENIKWGTKIENAHDKVGHGTNKGAHSGEDHHFSKLTRSQVDDIRSRPEYWGITIALGKEFNVSDRTIGKIRRGERWQ
jgi:hypothetical protein